MRHSRAGREGGRAASRASPANLRARSVPVGVPILATVTEEGFMQRRRLGARGPEVSAIGLGCMGMSDFYAPSQTDEASIGVIHRAIEIGIDFLDTADMYGPFTNERLVG